MVNHGIQRIWATCSTIWPSNSSSGEEHFPGKARLSSANTFNVLFVRSARRRVHVMRSWGSMFAMMPLGGETVWGNNTFAPDDSEAFSAQRENRSRSLSYGNMISYGKERKTVPNFSPWSEHLASDPRYRRKRAL